MKKKTITALFRANQIFTKVYLLSSYMYCLISISNWTNNNNRIRQKQHRWKFCYEETTHICHQNKTFKRKIDWKICRRQIFATTKLHTNNKKKQIQNTRDKKRLHDESAETVLFRVRAMYSTQSRRHGRDGKHRWLGQIHVHSMKATKSAIRLKYFIACVVFKNT